MADYTDYFMGSEAASVDLANAAEGYAKTVERNEQDLSVLTDGITQTLQQANAQLTQSNQVTLDAYANLKNASENLPGVNRLLSLFGQEEYNRDYQVLRVQEAAAQADNAKARVQNAQQAATAQASVLDARERTAKAKLGMHTTIVENNLRMLQSFQTLNAIEQQDVQETLQNYTTEQLREMQAGTRPVPAALQGRAGLLQNVIRSGEISETQQEQAKVNLEAARVAYMSNVYQLNKDRIGEAHIVLDGVTDEELNDMRTGAMPIDPQVLELVGGDKRRAEGVLRNEFNARIAANADVKRNELELHAMQRQAMFSRMDPQEIAAIARGETEITPAMQAIGVSRQTATSYFTAIETERLALQEAFAQADNMTLAQKRDAMTTWITEHATMTTVQNELRELEETGATSAVVEFTDASGKTQSFSIPKATLQRRHTALVQEAREIATRNAERSGALAEAAAKVDETTSMLARLRTATSVGSTVNMPAAARTDVYGKVKALESIQNDPSATAEAIAKAVDELDKAVRSAQETTVQAAPENRRGAITQFIETGQVLDYDTSYQFFSDAAFQPNLISENTPNGRMLSEAYNAFSTKYNDLVNAAGQFEIPEDGSPVTFNTNKSPNNAMLMRRALGESGALDLFGKSVRETAAGTMVQNLVDAAQEDAVLANWVSANFKVTRDAQNRPRFAGLINEQLRNERGQLSMGDIVGQLNDFGQKLEQPRTWTNLMLQSVSQAEQELSAQMVTGNNASVEEAAFNQLLLQNNPTTYIRPVANSLRVNINQSVNNAQTNARTAAQTELDRQRSAVSVPSYYEDVLGVEAARNSGLEGSVAQRAIDALNK